MELIITLTIIILFIIGGVFIIWGISFKNKTRHLYNECIGKCNCILIEIKEIEINHQINDKGRHYSTKSYVPIYEYEVQGNKYKIEGTNGTGFKIGDVVEINYNPEKPEQSYIEGYSFASWRVLQIIGIIILIMAIGLMFIKILIFNY